MEILTYEQISSAVIVFLVVCATVASIWSAIKVIKEMRKPQEVRDAKISYLEAQAKENKQAIKELKSSSRLMLKAETVIIQHLTTGDHQEDLVEMNDELHAYLWNHIE